MGRMLRGVARTAVVAGTATAVSNRVSRRQGERWARHDAAQQQDAPPPMPASVPAAAAATTSSDRIADLQNLAQLRQSGVLTEVEFEREKARILAS